jgi:beta-galactosidase
MKPPTPLRSVAPKLPAGLLYGGDYNPEQWPEEVWREDVRLMRAAGVNLVSLAIFSWAKLEPRPGEFNFDWLDRVVDLLWANGVSVCLATATASPPAWLSRAHPESLPVDVNGVRLSPGSRQHYCPNSRAYRAGGARLIGELARRYAAHPAVALWHVNNEIGCHTYECFCDVCAADFRSWLRARYGSLEALNESWGTAFWSQAYGDWEEILPPRKMPTFRNPGQVLDYARFMSGALCDVLAGEVAAIRAVAPEAKVTTNGLAFHRPVDYHRWYREVDIAAWDSYPDPSGGLDEVRAAAFNHDLFRGLRGGQPFMLMEQATTQVNWRPVNALKSDGRMRALSLAAVARGADAVMFFQWRASRAGAEKFHSAMVPHFGPEGRVFREVCALGEDLKKLAGVCGARTPARVALLVSWENRWALELESKPTAFDYAAIVQHYYGALWDLNLGVDVVHPDTPLDDYALVVAPALYQITRSQAEALRDFVRRGGALIMSYFSGVADERDHIWLGGYPALLQDVLGLAVEEWQPLGAGEDNALSVGGREVRCEKFCELLHLRGAEVLATYARGFFGGRPAVTRHQHGAGEAVYVATQPERGWLRELLGGLARGRGLAVPMQASPGVEIAVRCTGADEFLFVINHEAAEATVDFQHWSGTDLLAGARCEGATSLEPFGVRVLKRSRNV